jgi:hypothetical protein
VDGQFIDRHVREAVNEKLKKEGYALVAGDDANFFVAYHEGSVGGLSQGKWGVYSSSAGSYVASETAPELNSQTPSMGLEINPRSDGYTATKYGKQNTLVLDIRDSQKKLIWRGGRTAMIGSNPDELKKNIDHAVALLLAKFPPKTGTEAK